jgi:hypothetical protein
VATRGRLFLGAPASRRVNVISFFFAMLSCISFLCSESEIALLQNINVTDPFGTNDPRTALRLSRLRWLEQQGQARLASGATVWFASLSARLGERFPHPRLNRPESLLY